MKNNTFFVSGMLALLLTFVFALTGCLTSGGGGGDGTQTTTPTKFEGRWKNPYGGKEEPTFQFTGNTMRFTTTGGISQRGTFTFTDTEITFIPQRANSWKGYTQAYILSGNTLTLEEDGEHYYGPFEKQ
jgi:hypothetical protein